MPGLEDLDLTMRAIVYSVTGDPSVLHPVSKDVPEPAEGEVRVAVRFSGVNPTDWKSRRGTSPGQPAAFPDQVPDQDGAGVIDAVGAGVPDGRRGERVWIWEAAAQRPDGTAQEYVVVPAERAVPLPVEASFELGASLGVPAVTAHRCLTAGENVPDRLAAGSLDGRTVLVAGGAGAVGHAAIQLAHWAGATVIATISGPEKGALATAAGADHVVNYRTENAVERVRGLASDGVDVIAEVAPGPNAALDAAVVARHGTVAVYANNGGDELTLPIRALMAPNARWQFVLVYTEPDEAKRNALRDVSAAVAAGVLPVGAEHGLPLHVFDLEYTADAHAAVEDGVVGKVLVEVLPAGVLPAGAEAGR